MHILDIRSVLDPAALLDHMQMVPDIVDDLPGTVIILLQFFIILQRQLPLLLHHQKRMLQFSAFCHVIPEIQAVQINDQQKCGIDHDPIISVSDKKDIACHQIQEQKYHTGHGDDDHPVDFDILYVRQPSAYDHPQYQSSHKKQKYP